MTTFYQMTFSNSCYSSILSPRNLIQTLKCSAMFEFSLVYLYIFLKYILFEIFNFIQKCLIPQRINGTKPQICLNFAALLLWHTLSQKCDLNVKQLTHFSTLSWFKRYSNPSHGFSAIAVGRTSVFEKNQHLASLNTLGQSERGTRRAVETFWINCPHGQTIRRTRMLFCIFVAASVLSHTMSSPQHMDKQKLNQSQLSDIRRTIFQAFPHVKRCLFCQRHF